MNETKLKRHIGLKTLIFFGVGDILGAGIYGLTGKAAGAVGNAVWLAFLVSMLAAGLTGLSYASLGSRYPHAGGVAVVSLRAFNNKFLAYVTGLLALCSGITSMAAGSRAFAGYFSGFFHSISYEAVVAFYCILIALIVIRGIRESMWMNILCTSIELIGLLLVIVFGIKFIGSVNYLDAVTVNNPSGDLSFSLIMSGAVLTFFSFVGFEDMLNISEEVKDPERNLPIGIIAAVLISSAIYVIVSIVSVSVLPPITLESSKEPLVDVVRAAAPWFPSILFSIIAMFAVANTALLNFVMGSRMLYGMANHGLAPRLLAKVSSTRRTPYVASLVLLAILLALALSGDVSVLARATSILLLFCFFTINVALVVLQKKKNEKKGRFEIPTIIPIAGSIVCAVMLSYSKTQELKISGLLLGIIVVLYFFLRPKHSDITHLEK